MRSIRANTIGSSVGILALYSLASLLVCTGFCLLLPPAPAPLPIYRVRWLWTMGAQRFIALYPAIALSALAIPYGFISRDFIPFRSSRAVGNAADPSVLDTFKAPIVAAIVAVCINGLLFLMAGPMLNRAEGNMRALGSLFYEAEQKAWTAGRQGDWLQADGYLRICERVWPSMPDLADLRRTITISLESQLLEDNAEEPSPYQWEAAPGGYAPRASILRNPVDALQALEFGEAAMREERYYDAHWLATLAGRLAPAGSAEKTRRAPELAARAWNAISAMEPKNRETQLYRLFHQKNAGYAAVLAQDWISGYFIFQGLASVLPQDPDVRNFYQLCESQLGGIAFFADELDLLYGERIAAPLFSIPLRNYDGSIRARLALQLGVLSINAAMSYGTDVEAIQLDDRGAPQSRMEAPYVKIIPQGETQTVLLFHTLDRRDSSRHWEPTWTNLQSSAAAWEDGMRDSQVTLDIPYEDFLLMARASQGLERFLIPELLRAERSLEPYGHIPQVFRAELIRRIAEPALLLPLCILIIIIGWRLRITEPRGFVRYCALVLLPAAFYLLIELYRVCISTMGICMALTFNSYLACGVLIAGTLALFILTLLGLARQDRGEAD